MNRQSYVVVSIEAIAGVCLALNSANVYADSAADSTSAGQLEEVIVTAERHSVDIEKTPLAITAISGSALEREGVVDAQGLQDIVPSLNITTTGENGTSIAIRGLVSQSLAPQGGPAAAVNIDDVYIARSQATVASFFDIQRVEVLEGPQGTLYGKNSTAGVVNIITNDPAQNYDGYVSVDVGNFNEITIAGAQNVPITSQLALRASFQSVHHDGYIGQLDDADSYAARIKLMYTPVDDLSIVLSGHYNHIGGYGDGDVAYSLAPGAVNPSNPWTNNEYQPDTTQANRYIRGLEGRAVWDLHFATLTYIVGEEDLNLVNDKEAGGGSPSNINQLSHTVSNELRLASANQSSQAGSLRWVAGAYAFNESQSFAPVFGSATSPISVHLNEPDIPDSSQAVFGQATYSLTDTTRLTGGLRWTHDYEAQIGTFAVEFNGSPEPFLPHFPVTGSVTNSNLSWKLGLEQDLTPNVLGYLSATTGYHAGGLDDTVPATAAQGNVYSPEKVIDYEAGIKARWYDNRLQVNANIFYEDYTDMQVGVTSVQASLPGIYNADKARLMGAELSSSWLITKDDLLRYSFIYEDSRYVSFCVPSALYTGSGPITQCASGQMGYNYSAFPFNYVPKWAGNLSYQHTFELNGGGAIVPRVATRFKTQYTGGVETYEMPAYSNSEAMLTYQAPADRWSIMAYVRNIEDKPDYTYSNNQMGSPIHIYLIPGAPRTYGLHLDINW